MFLRALGIVFVVLAVSGCALMKKKSMMSDEQARVTQLEQKLDEKDSELADL